MWIVSSWIILLLPLSGVVSDTCSTPNLYSEFKDKFDKKDSDLKKYGGNYLKCLAMYDNHNMDGKSALTSATLKNITNHISGSFMYNLIGVLTDGHALSHNDFFPAFKKTCIYVSHLKNFGPALGPGLLEPGLLYQDKYSLKLTCPLGLLWDVACTFTSCLLSDCDVNGEECSSSEMGASSCQSFVDMQLYCKTTFASFLKSCVDDADLLEFELVEKLNEDFKDEQCSDFNYVYQGLTSLQVVNKSLITVDCQKDKNVSLTCFNDGKALKSATWFSSNGIELGKGRTLLLSLNDLTDNNKFSCYQDSIELAEIHAHTINQLCQPDEEESNDSELVKRIRNTLIDTERTTSAIPTTTERDDDSKREHWKKFYTDRDGTWFYEEDYGSLEGLDAFNYKAKLQVDKLSIPMVSVMGRLTPICGELWNERAAEVFCREAGAQVQQTWNVSFVGSLHKSHNERHNVSQYYKHYLRNITCKGDESNIIWCDHDGWYHHKGCTHDAVVICKIVSDSPIDKGTIALIVIMFMLGTLALTAAIIWIIMKWSPHYFDSSPIKNLLNKICNKPSPEQPQPTGEPVETPAPETPATEFDSIFFKSRSDSVDLLDSGYSLFSMTSIGSSVVIDPDEGPVIPLPEVIVIKRLNPQHAKGIVLLCEIEGEILVAKSYENDASSSTIVGEQYFLSQANHPNVVKCVGEPRSITYDNASPMVFFMEKLDFGGLDSYLRSDMDASDRVNCGFNQNGHLMTIEDATNVIVGICRSLHYVHSLGYVHGDISTDNFFAYRNSNTGLLDVKLGDFESIYRPPVRPDGGHGWEPVRCTYLYSAPEIILQNPRDVAGNEIQKDAFKNDVWGLAWVVWEIQSWVMCKNSKLFSDRRARERPEHVPQPGQSSLFLSSVLQMVRSRIMPTDNYGCRRHMHVALLKKINVVNPSMAAISHPGLPDKPLMTKFYQKIHPDNIGPPSMDPSLDREFGWPITELVKKCLAIDSAKRFSMKQAMQFLLRHANHPDSALFRYKDDLESDLRKYGNCSESPMNLEDITAFETVPPQTLQSNLGQLGS